MINYIRTVAGEVIEKGVCLSMADLARLRQNHPGQYLEDNGRTPLTPIKPPKALKAAKAETGITLEEIADALLGDKKALAALKRKREKVKRDGANNRGPAQRPAGRNKATSE